MSRSELEELIQGELDGVNSGAESVRLEVILASRPDLEARLGSLKRVSETLGRAGRLAPPPGFVDVVMREVRRREPARNARPGWAEALRTLFTPVPLAACAAALVVGVVLGGLLPPAAVLSRSDQSALSGTALSHGRLRPSGIQGRQAIVREGLQGEAVTRIEEGQFVLELDLETTRAVDVALDLAGTGLTPRSLSLDDAPGGELVMSGEAVRFTQAAGRHRYSLSFAVGEPSGRALKLRVGGGEAWELALGREGPR